MKFKVLQENLRKILWDRIEAGELTGLRLSQQAGFRQAHISNFLNKKRGLSLEGMDKVLAVQHLSVLDLLDPDEVNQRATILPPSEDEFENILLTNPSAAATQPQIASVHIKEILKFRKTFLEEFKPAVAGDREYWRRFIVINADARLAAGMHPRIMPGAALLLDRHYNSLAPYRKGEFNLYAVLKDGTCIVRYVEVAANHLILRPHEPSAPIELIAIAKDKSPADYLVGRVCYVCLEA